MMRLERNEARAEAEANGTLRVVYDSNAPALAGTNPEAKEITKPATASRKPKSKTKK